MIGFGQVFERMAHHDIGRHGELMVRDEARNVGKLSRPSQVEDLIQQYVVLVCYQLQHIIIEPNEIQD